MERARVRLLGPVDVVGVDGVARASPSALRRTLLALLAVRAGQVVTGDWLLEHAWGSEPPPSGLRALRFHVSQLRKELPVPGQIETRPGGYRLDPDSADVDVLIVERLVGEARATGDAVARYEMALALWRGTPFVDAAPCALLDDEAHRLVELRLAILDEYFRARLADGADAELVPDLVRLVSEHPLREPLWSALITAEYRAGRQADALRSYERLRTTLAELTGLSPSPELVELEARVLRHAPDLRDSSWPSGGNGRRGLVEARDTQRLPPSLELLADPATFVGRTEVRSQLRDLWRRAGQGKLLVAVVAGEAGMGKSRIAAELALEVDAEGGQVRLGACLEELRIPYEPFVQILSSDAASLTDAALAERVGRGGPVLARVAPDLASRLGLATPDSEAEGPLERAEIFATLRDYVERAARQCPLLVVIEDLHWSTATTRDSLRYLARLSGAAPALLVLTSRDSAPDLDDAVAGFLAEIGRQPCAEVISLSPLTEEDVARLLAENGRSGAAGEVCAATGGNPLLALESSGGDRRANSVSSLLSARFDLLAAAEMDLLDVAVVIGSEFRADLVAAAAGRDLGSVLEALESAKDAGLVSADPRESLRFSFVHALFRTVRYESMRTSARLRLHAAISAVLRPRADDERVLPVLAHHACAAAPLGHAEDAVMLARRAGHLARRRRGYDEAAEQYERALSMLELIPSASTRLGLLLRVDLAAVLFDGGRPAGLPLLQAVIEEARHHADDEALANAMIALSGITRSPSFGGRVDDEIALMLSEALDRVPAEPSGLRARLLVALSGQLRTEDVVRAREIARAAIDMAGVIGDLSAVGDGLMTYRWLIFEPEFAGERVAVGDELIALGRTLDEPKFTTGGLSQLLHVHRESGDLAAAASVRAEMEALCALRPHPVTQAIVITYRATERFLAGDLADAEATAETLLDFGSESGVEVFNLYALILGAIRSQQGRYVEQLPFIEQAVAEQPSHRGFLTAVLARALTRAGRLDDAAGVLHELAVADYDVPHDANWLVATEQLADAVEILGDRAAAAVLRKRLTPFAGRIANTLACVTRPIDQALAQLALVVDDLDGAAAAATRAIAASRTRNTPIFLGRELVLLATARRRVGAPEREIQPLVEEAQQIADATGAHLIDQEIARYGLSPAHSGPDQSERRETP